MPSPFDDDTAARELLERLRWPDGPTCPRCAARGHDNVFRIGGEKHSHRDGLYQCKPCRHQFTVTVGTAFERQRIPLSTWVRAALEFSYEAPAYGRDKYGKPKPPLLTKLKTKLGVSYRTVLRIRNIIEYAVSKYRGYKIGFGTWLRSLMKHGSTPKQQRSLDHKAKLLAAGKHPSQQVSFKSSGLLAGVMSDHKTADTRAAFDRTEVLLRLLLATPAKPAPRKRRKKRPATDNSSQERTSCLTP
jgi:Transposase zinc-ribbon domain